MKRTVDEKYKYNQSRKDTFSTGYCTGVNLYRSYTKSDGETKAMIKEIITTSKELAQEGDDLGKGVMCAVRDCAEERKAKQRRR